MREHLLNLSSIHNILQSDETRKARNRYRKVYREKIKLTRINYNKKFINTAKNKCKAMWTVINESRNNLGSNNSDSKQACDISRDNFNDYFTNVAPCLINDLPTDCENPIQLMSDNFKFMSLCSNNAFEFTEVSMVQVRDVINDLKNSNCKYVLVDNLNVNLIKTIRDLIISPLTKLINQSFRLS